jgi:CheY-like chemotaxis protein
VVGSVTTVTELLNSVNCALPDIVIVDLNMPDGNGISACRRIKQLHPIMEVILLTAQDDADNRAAAMEAGATEFVSKGKAYSQLPLAIRAISSRVRTQNAAGESALPVIPSELQLFQKARDMRPILLVEDDVRDVELTMAALEACDATRPVIVARDGQEALEHLQKMGATSHDALPAALLLDLKLPRVDGFEVLERMKCDTHLNAIPVVVLTASAQERDLRRSRELGARKVLTKPNSFLELRSTLQQLRPLWCSTESAS